MHKPLQRVVWSEGSLVSPQHLQQLDLYHESLLDERIAGLTPDSVESFMRVMRQTDRDRKLGILEDLE